MMDDPATSARRNGWRRALAAAPWLVVALAAANGAIGTRLILEESGQADTLTTLVDAVWVWSPVVWALLGAFIVHRQPGNLIGWLMVIPVLGGLSIDSAMASAPNPPVDPSLGDLVALWYINVSWTPLIMAILLMFALFPTGRPLNDRWQWHKRLVLGMWGFFLFYVTFASSVTSLDTTWSVDNPIGFLPAALFDAAWFSIGWTVGLMVSAVGGVVAMVTRFRRGSWVERQQLKWLIFAVTFFAASYVVTAVVVTLSEQAEVTEWEGIALVDLMLAGSILFIPVAMTIAILRHRVLDIDVLIRRTVVYATLTTLLAGTYLGSVLLFRTFVETALGSDSAFGVAGSTLLVAALFNPVRTRIQRGVGRRFFRGPYDAAQVLASFSASARDQTDVELLSGQLHAAVAAALRPAAIGLTLTPGRIE